MSINKIEIKILIALDAIPQTHRNFELFLQLVELAINLFSYLQQENFDDFDLSYLLKFLSLVKARHFGEHRV